MERSATKACQEAPLPAAAPAASGDAVPASKMKQHKKKKNEKKDGVNSQDVVMAAAAVCTQMSPHAPAFVPGDAAASARVLEKKSSRERSPRRDASLRQPSSYLPSPSLATSPAPAAGVDVFSVGQSAVLDGLVSLPELSRSLVTLHSFDAAASRWPVTLGTTGESIRVQVCNLRTSIFSSGASADYWHQELHVSLACASRAFPRACVSCFLSYRTFEVSFSLSDRC